MNTHNDDEPRGHGNEAVTCEPDETPEIVPNSEPSPPLPREIGGRQGPEPTRFGDWEKNGRCIDF